MPFWEYAIPRLIKLGQLGYKPRVDMAQVCSGDMMGAQLCSSGMNCSGSVLKLILGGISGGSGSIFKQMANGIPRAWCHIGLF